MYFITILTFITLIGTNVCQDAGFQFPHLLPLMHHEFQPNFHQPQQLPAWIHNRNAEFQPNVRDVRQPQNSELPTQPAFLFNEDDPIEEEPVNLDFPQNDEAIQPPTDNQKQNQAAEINSSNPHPEINQRIAGFNNPFQQSNNGEEVVGIGLAKPLAGALALGAKMNAAALAAPVKAAATAKAVGLASKAAVHKGLLKAQLNKDITILQAKKATNKALLGPGFLKPIYPHNPIYHKLINPHKPIYPYKPIFPYKRFHHPLLGAENPEDNHPLLESRNLEDNHPLLEARYPEDNHPLLESRNLEDNHPLLEARYPEDNYPLLESRNLEDNHPLLEARNPENNPQINQDNFERNLQPGYTSEVPHSIGLLHDALSHPIVAPPNYYNHGITKRDIQDDESVIVLDDADVPVNSEPIIDEVEVVPVLEELNNKNRGSTGRKTNRHRDEELFVWSLNNWNNNFKRSIPDDDDLCVTTVSGSPIFFNQHDINPIAHNYARSNNDEDNTFKVMKSRVAEPHFGKHFGKWGLHRPNRDFHEGFSTQHTQVDHWGNPMQFLNNKDIKPTHVTINNQQNTFTNSIPTHTGGSNSIQISQTNGQSAGSQAHASAKAADIVSSPHIIEIPMRRHSFLHKRSIDFLNKQNSFNDLINESKYMKAKHVKRGYLQDFRKAVPKKARLKRSVPLLKLAIDPNAKLDMSKTMENVGTIAKQSFENKHTPMYHVRNMIGSTKDAMLSAMRMAPQDLIVPSKYRIIDTSKDVVITPEELQSLKNKAKASDAILSQVQNAALSKPTRSLTLKEKFEQFKLNPGKFLNSPRINEISFKAIPERSEIVRQSNPNNDDFMGTFHKLGSAFRDCVKSGQDTMGHIGEAAHSARKMLRTAPLAVPRVLLPYTRAPALKKPDTVMLIGPRMLGFENDETVENNDNFVHMGDIMDAFGISNPEADRVGLRKYTIRKKQPIIQSRFGEEDDIVGSSNVDKYTVIAEDIDDIDATNVDNAWKTLKGIREVVGVGTIKNFLVEMKNDFTVMKDKLEHKKKLEEQMLYDLNSEDDELNNFLKNLFQNNESEKPKIESRFADDGIVGAGMPMSPNLLKPFMNQPSRIEIETFFRNQGNNIEDIDEFNKVSSINSDLYQKLFNETLPINETSNVDTQKLFEEAMLGQQLGYDEHGRRISMNIPKKLMKPYMGKIDTYDGYSGMPYDGYDMRPDSDEYN